MKHQYQISVVCLEIPTQNRHKRLSVFKHKHEIFSSKLLLEVDVASKIELQKLAQAYLTDYVDKNRCNEARVYISNIEDQPETKLQAGTSLIELHAGNEQNFVSRVLRCKNCGWLCNPSLGTSDGMFCNKPECQAAANQMTKLRLATEFSAHVAGGYCAFDIPWHGLCGKLADKGQYCTEHQDVKCRVCGKQATHECAVAGSLVCGIPLCGSCECPLHPS